MEFNRFKQLLESKLGDVKPLIIEQNEEIVQGSQGDPYQYKKVGDKFFYSKKGINDWTEATKQQSIQSIKSKIFNLEPKNLKKDVNKPITQNVVNKQNVSQTKDKTTNKNFCPTLSKNTKDISDINQILSIYKDYNTINVRLNSLAKIFANVGEFPKRISCQMALNKLRPGYKDKNLIVVDTLQKLLYLFNKNGEFIEKTYIISGKSKQSQNPNEIAKSLLSWDDSVKTLGFKWVSGKGYVDNTGKNRKFNEDDVLNVGGRYLPKGIYTTGGKIGTDPTYAGGKDNELFLNKGNNELMQAIHGYYVEAPRTKALEKAKKLMNNPKDPSATKEFLDAISSGNLNLSQSYGCINVPKEFLPTLRTYMKNSYVFNIGETGDNYLVNNTENYFDKMMNSESCPSPKSLGAEPTIGFEYESETRMA